MSRYEYTAISEQSKKYAIKELKENPSELNAHIESLRRWVLSMPHLKCPTDSNFLLRFLRVAKFDHKKAEKRLDNFCTIRSSERGVTEFYNYSKITESLINDFLNLKLCIPLSRLDNGELIVLMRMKTYDHKVVPFDKFLIALFMGYDILLEEEETQIHGVQLLVDLEDISRKTLEYIGEPKIAKEFYMTLQDSYPMRFKGQMFYNEPVIFDIVYQVFAFFLNDKLKSRTQRFKHNIRKGMEKVPGLEKVLPKEYGGQGLSLDEYADNWSKKYREHYKNGYPLADVKIDESKRPKETLSYLATFTDFKGETLGKAGTFTKFENVF